MRFSDADVVIKASADTTGGAFAIVEEIAPLDTPLHVHEREDEVFYVLEGRHVVEVGDTAFRLGPTWRSDHAASRTRSGASCRGRDAS